MRLDSAASPSLEVIEFNVGGTTFATCRSTVLNQPESRLAKWVTGEMPAVRDSQQRIFIDRDPETFRHILRNLRTGELPRLEERQLAEFAADAQFLGFDGVPGELALRRLQEAAEKDPGNTACVGRWLDALLEAGRYAEALDAMFNKTIFGTRSLELRFKARAEASHDPVAISLANLFEGDFDPDHVAESTAALHADREHPIVALYLAWLQLLPCIPFDGMSDDGIEDRLKQCVVATDALRVAYGRVACGISAAMLSVGLIGQQSFQDRIAAIRTGDGRELVALGSSGTESIEDLLRLFTRHPCDALSERVLEFYQGDFLLADGTIALLQLYKSSILQAIDSATSEAKWGRSMHPDKISEWTIETARLGNERVRERRRRHEAAAATMVAAPPVMVDPHLAAQFQVPAAPLPVRIAPQPAVVVTRLPATRPVAPL